MIYKIPKEIEFLFETFKKYNKELYLVGGCVRDMLLELEPKDYDLATNALPTEVLTYFEHTIPTGIDYGTVTVMLDGLGYEITTYRKDHDADGRRPKAVSFSKTIEEDLCRRDFTINSMAMDAEGNLIDLYGGKEDLNKGIIRFVGNSIDRVNEDKLRLIRGIRFATTYGFSIDQNDFETVYLNAKEHDFSLVANERFVAEFNKILLAETPSKGVKLLMETGIMDVFIPELKRMVGFEQNNPNHSKDVFGHTLDVLDYLPKHLILRLSGLFHDIGKPETYTVDDKGIGHFYKHDYVSAEMTEAILMRLKYDKKTIQLVKLLVDNHMRKTIPKKKSGIRRLIRDIGEENIYDFLKLLDADESATNHIPGDKYKEYAKTIEAILKEAPPLTRDGLAVNGRDMMEDLNLSGKIIGEVLNYLTEAVLEDPDLNKRETLIQLSTEYLSKNIKK